jgi:hypothetical protein
VPQLRDGDLEPLHGAEHGDGRGDDAVTVEEGRPEEPESDEETPARLLEEQGNQGEDPAFSLVVQTHDDQHVLDADNEDERPDDEGQHAVHAGWVAGQADLFAEAGPEGVERARADVPEDHAEGSQGQDAQASAGGSGDGGGRQPPL